MDQLKIESTAGLQNGVRILRLTGAFTLSGVSEFQSIARAGDDPVTILDLTGVPYLDSAALGSILATHTTAHRNQRRFALVGASEKLQTLFRVAGVDRLLVTYRTVEEAQEALAGNAAG